VNLFDSEFSASTEMNQSKNTFSTPVGTKRTEIQQCIAVLKREKIQVVAFDMDLTAVSSHSRGCLLRTELDNYLSQVTPDFLTLVPELHKFGFHLAIATHSDEAEFGGEVQPETHILGTELATALVSKFEPETASSIFIVAYNPRHHPDDAADENKLIKRYHMNLLKEKFQVEGKNIIFFDDTEHVVDDCRKTCGVHAFVVDPNHGFRLIDLLRNFGAT